MILRPSDWRHSPLGELQALPANAKPVSKWSDREEAFLSIALGIRKVAEALAQRPARCSAQPEDGPAANATRSPDATASNHTPLPPATTGCGDDATAPVPLDNPEGPVRHDSSFYIAPPEEARRCAELDRPGALIRIKGPRGFDRLTFPARLLAYARAGAIARWH